MSFDRSVFPRPPGQTTIRIVDEPGPLTLTNLRLECDLQEQGGPLGSTGRLLQANVHKLALAGSCFANLWVAIGWVFLVFGVVFVGGITVAVFAMDVPFQINGQPTDKFLAAVFLLGFLVFWVLFCALWIYLSRSIFFNLNRLNQNWRLVLGDDEWICYRAFGNQVIGRCAPANIETLFVSPVGVVTAKQSGGNSIDLSGRLAPFEATWLRDALAQYSLRPVDHPELSAHPYVPAPSSLAVPGLNLAWQLPRTDAPWTAVFVILAISLFWNGVTSVFVWQAFLGNAQIAWWLVLFLIPFVLVGFILVAAFCIMTYTAIVQSRIGKTTVEIQVLPLRLGQSCQALVSQVGPLNLKRLSIQLVCEEQATFRQGTSTRTETKIVGVLEVFEAYDLRIEKSLPLENRFEIRVPDDVMHSFEAQHNEIVWKLLVRGEPENWPQFVREYPIVIAPPPSTATRAKFAT